MTLQVISPPVGVYLTGSPYSAGKSGGYTGIGTGIRQGSGRWTIANNIEFISGQPQKVAGWISAAGSTTIGIPRAFRQWLADASNGTVYTGIGTDSHLYYLDGAGVLHDITPKTTVTISLTDAITVHSNSAIVTIADATGVWAVGDLVGLFATTTVSNVLLNGWYNVASVNPGVGYTITYSVPALADAGPGGGAIVANYPRTTQANPFTTTLGSSIVHVNVAVTQTYPGQFVTFSGATAVGGLTINGPYVIVTVIDNQHYTIDTGIQATSSAGPGGGANVTAVYDVPQIGSLTPLGLNGWTLDAYGNQLLAASIGGTIYVYDRVFPNTRAYPMKNAPATMMAMFVTPERFVVALGINGNLMQIAWADQSDYTDWTTTPTNTANSGRTLVGGSYFVAGKAVRDGVSIIWTDKCAFEMAYLGSFEVYSTQLFGDQCGLVSPNAVAVEGGIAYWINDSSFWTWNGSAVQIGGEDVRTAIFNPNTVYSINPDFLRNCVVVLNRTKHQLRMYYPEASNPNGENNLGLIYQYDDPCFSTLAYGRSGAYDSQLGVSPVSGDTTGAIYYEENGTDANGSALSWNLQLSEMDISNGDRNADIFGFIPDYDGGNVNLFVWTQEYPNTTETTSGPFPLTVTTGRVDLRLDGKIFFMSMSANILGSTFRFGAPRLDVQPSGARL